MAKAPQNETKREASNRSLIEWIESIAWEVVAVMLLFTFVGRVVQVDGPSMQPTLYNGEKLIITSLPYAPHNGDIIVTDAHNPHGQVLIKRVIGCPGDTIDIDFDAGIVYRNGEPLSEPYTAAPTFLEEGTDLPLTVPAGRIFIMGDNRNDSLDSRSPEVGLVDVRDVMGRVLWRILPLSRLGAVP